MATVTNIWDRIHLWLEANAPEVLKSLEPGATEEQLEALQEKLGLNNLPEDFKACYRIHNGSSADYFFGSPNSSNTFSPIDDIIKDWLMHKEVQETSDFGEYSKNDEEEGLEIQSIWWSPKWIPFGENGCGDYLFLDLAPTEVGTVGQVIQWYHDGDDSELKATSFREFLSGFADDLEAEQFLQTNDDGLIRLLHKEYIDE